MFFASGAVDGAGQLEVLGGESAGVVRGEGERDRVVADVDVGMMAGLLGQITHAIDERQRLAEITEAVAPLDLGARALPARRLAQGRSDAGLVQPAHTFTNFCSDRISRGGFSSLPCAVHETSATQKSPRESTATPCG